MFLTMSRSAGGMPDALIILWAERQAIAAVRWNFEVGKWFGATFSFV